MNKKAAAKAAEPSTTATSKETPTALTTNENVGSNLPVEAATASDPATATASSDLAGPKEESADAELGTASEVLTDMSSEVSIEIDGFVHPCFY
eukprot:SAG31_NODE_18959_length_616_cov_1.394584_1_plen_94_part_00